MEKLKYWIDKKGRLEKIFRPIIEREFPLLKHVNFLFTWRNVPKYDEDGLIIIAEVRRCSNKERDLYGYDFEINVYRNAWDELSLPKKVRVAWHELNHCDMEVDEDGQPARDDCGRIIIWVKNHDLIIRSFKDEVTKFGLASSDYSTAKFLYREWKLKRKGGGVYSKKMNYNFKDTSF